MESFGSSGSAEQVKDDTMQMLWWQEPDSVVGGVYESCHNPSDGQACGRDLALWDTFLFIRRGTLSSSCCQKCVVITDSSLPNDPYQILDEGDTISRSLIEDVIRLPFLNSDHLISLHGDRNIAEAMRTSRSTKLDQQKAFPESDKTWAILSLAPCGAAHRESVQNPLRFLLNIDVGILEGFSERAYCS